MKATGEVMAIAPNFEGALMKAIRSLELNVKALRLPKLVDVPTYEIEEKLKNIDDERIFVIAEALRRGISMEEINCHHQGGSSGSWTSYQAIVDTENAIQNAPL